MFTNTPSVLSTTTSSVMEDIWQARTVARLTGDKWKAGEHCQSTKAQSKSKCLDACGLQGVPLRVTHIPQSPPSRAVEKGWKEASWGWSSARGHQLQTPCGWVHSMIGDCFWRKNNACLGLNVLLREKACFISYI